MLLLILFIAIAIGLLVLATVLFHFNFDGVGAVVAFISVILWIVIIIMSFVAVINNIGTKGLIAENEQRYESLVYQLEHDLYNNDNDLGKKELYDEIREWNEDLAHGKVMQHDLWVGIFYPDIYDGFEFIKLGGEEES